MLNPIAEKTPAMKPTHKEPPGEVMISEQVPIATPPARVAFIMMVISSFPNKSLAVKAAPIHPEAIERLVLTNTLFCWLPSAARAPLNDGQNIQRNTDPTRAMISVLWLETLFGLEEARVGWKW